jgi:transcriptional antiterminator NusG
MAPAAREPAPNGFLAKTQHPEVEMTESAISYEPGDLVRVVDGPFASFAGVVREVDAASDELSVEVTLLGRPVPIRTEPWQVTRR